MRRFRDIVEDIKAPSPQSLWLDKGKLKFFGTKGWASMVGEGEVNLSEYVKSNEIYQCIKKDYDSSKRGEGAIAIDDSAKASSNFATAIGNNARATGYRSTALGVNAQATKDYSVALCGQATGEGSIAIKGQATDYYSIALGYNARATGKSSTALGDNAQATGYHSIALGNNAHTSTVSKYALGGADDNKLEMFNIEEITYSEYGNKKYLIGLGGYDGTNITINNEAGEEVLNPNIKSVQEIINEKADLVSGKLKAEQLPKLVNITTASTAEEVVTKFNALLTDLKAKGYMEADTAK